MQEIIDKLNYDRETGHFSWAVSVGRKKAGDRAGIVHKSGYIIIGVNNKKHYAHRLVFLMEDGQMPSGDVDHINHVKTDNRLSNLRIVSKSENQRNRPKNKSNQSGKTGVCWHKGSNKWQAQIMIKGKQRGLGYFDKVEEAIKRREEAEKSYGFHSNHGK